MGTRPVFRVNSEQWACEPSPIEYQQRHSWPRGDKDSVVARAHTGTKHAGSDGTDVACAVPNYNVTASASIFPGAGGFPGPGQRTEPEGSCCKSWGHRMEPDRLVVTWTRTLLRLPAETGERFPDEWAAVRRRIESVHSLSIPYDAEPAGGPRLESLDD
jgi:hypothetical protein